jgi:hypothetical protein
MNSREDLFCTEDCPQSHAVDLPHSIGDVLEELLAQYQVRFPELELTVVESRGSRVESLGWCATNGAMLGTGCCC